MEFLDFSTFQEMPFIFENCLITFSRLRSIKHTHKGLVLKKPRYKLKPGCMGQMTVAPLHSDILIMGFYLLYLSPQQRNMLNCIQRQMRRKRRKEKQPKRRSPSKKKNPNKRRKKNQRKNRTMMMMMMVCPRNQRLKILMPVFQRG